MTILNYKRMLKRLEKMREERRRKTYLRIPTNKMTIVAARLFRKNPPLHLAFICYRLKMDFGFTVSEICNFTGIPPRTLFYYLSVIRKMLYAKVFDILATEDFQKAIEEWENKDVKNGATIAWYIPQKGTKINKNAKFDEETVEKWGYFGEHSEKFFTSLFGRFYEYLKQEADQQTENAGGSAASNRDRQTETEGGGNDNKNA